MISKYSIDKSAFQKCFTYTFCFVFMRPPLLCKKCTVLERKCTLFSWVFRNLYRDRLTKCWQACLQYLYLERNHSPCEGLLHSTITTILPLLLRSGHHVNPCSENNRAYRQKLCLEWGRREWVMTGRRQNDFAPKSE